MVVMMLVTLLVNRVIQFNSAQPTNCIDKHFDTVTTEYDRFRGSITTTYYNKNGVTYVIDGGYRSHSNDVKVCDYRGIKAIIDISNEPLLIK